ncbi:MAG: DUF349 domain-containing protein [Reinekea sp.]
MNSLVEAIGKGQFSAAEAIQSLPADAALMLAIQLDEAVSEQSQDIWVQLVKEGFTAKIRKYAASQVSDPEQLQTLVKATKGKDKAVFRILQETLESQSEQLKQIQQRTKKTDTVLQAMKRLAEAPYEPMYEAKVKGLIEQWRELDVAEDALKTDFQSAQDACHVKIEAVKAVEQAQRAEVESLKMADSNRQQLIEQMTNELRARLSANEMTDEELHQDQHLLADVQHQWRETEQFSKASRDETRAFQKVCTAFEISLPKYRQILANNGSVDGIISKLENPDTECDALLHEVDDWLHEIDFLFETGKPEPIQKLTLSLEKYQKSLEEHRRQEIGKVRAIRTQLRRCLSAVEEGSIRRASGLYHGVEEKLKDFNLDQHPGIKKQLDETTEAIEKLRDWQSYAVLPKKQALIKKMEALIHQSLDPESRANTIRDMQDEWKLLSRGLQDHQQELWETFHDLAQKAYEPCREYFSEQRNLREVNLGRRKEVVEQLRTYSEIINWDEPDIREIDRVLQAARNDWRHYSPVDRVANKDIQKTFDQLHRSIMDKLRAEQSVFRDNKLAIIEKAKQLLELDDAREATEQAKQLQQQWKSAGMVARKNEQELWKAFREVCDELFERREQQIKEFKTDLESHKTEAESIIKRIGQLSDADQILEVQSDFEKLKQAYDQVGTLPKSHYTKLSRQFKDACSKYQRAVRQAEQKQSDRHWIDLINWVKQARFSSESLDALQAQWAQMDVPEPARSLTDCLSVWQQAPDEVNQTRLHEKTVDLEILTGVESPEADSKMRMNLQVQRLSEGIGSQTDDSEIDRVVVEWLSVGAVSEDFYAEMEHRMKQARTQYLK